MSDCTLFNTIQDYSKTKARYHMPGHNGTALFAIDSTFDITELPFSDNLLFSSGVILGAEQQLAEAYGYGYSAIFTQGATSVILAAVHALGNRSLAVAVDSDAHRSCFSAAELLGMDIVVYDSSAFGGLDYSKIGVIIITSPNYYGALSDYSAVLEAADANGIRVILDQSHGSHYRFSSLLPTQPCDGIDIVINSMHKTLPCLTGAAVALMNDESVYKKMNYSRSLTHSTSPNYMIMASIDYCRSEMTAHGEVMYQAVAADIAAFESSLNPLYFSITHTDDFTRMLIACGDTSGLTRYLASTGVFPEMTFPRHIMLIITPYNSAHLRSLSATLSTYTDIPNSIRLSPTADYSVITARVAAPMTTSQYGLDSEVIAIISSKGRVSAANIGLYPPGTPLLRRGEVITAETIDFIMLNIPIVFGLDNGGIRVYNRFDNNIQR